MCVYLLSELEQEEETEEKEEGKEAPGEEGIKSIDVYASHPPIDVPCHFLSPTKHTTHARLSMHALLRMFSL